jgi:tetratricopeptide (TPR) repeat protein
VSERGWQTESLDRIEPLGNWLPVRRRLGVTAFGVNAWIGGEGDHVIEEHDEATSGHEELYVVVRGSATFTVGGEEVDAPTGTAVFVSDPAARRGAVAREADTLVFTVGAKPGEAYEPLGWEENADIVPLFARGEYAHAKERLLAAIERWPDSSGLFYNLACAESRLGETDAALGHLARVIGEEPRFADYARADEDLEAIRADQRFAELVG